MLIKPGTVPVKFTIEENFRNKLLSEEVKWNIPGLSEFTFMRTYSRKKDNGKLETWNECVVRVIEGMFTVLKTYCDINLIPWNENKAQCQAEEAATRMFNFKWLPPGRGLWMMGTDYMWERGSACLNNCAFVSTERMGESVEETVLPFKFLMDVSMVGVGCGFDTRGKDRVTVLGWNETEHETFVVQDTRESWVELIGKVIEHCIYGKSLIIPDISLVRPEGQPIRGFGGISSGPTPLVQAFYGIADVINKKKGKTLSSVDIVDIQNLIGKCVVAGNVRRTAEIAFSDIDDSDFINMKDWNQFPLETGNNPPEELKNYGVFDQYWDNQKDIVKEFENHKWSYKFGGWRWASNNSVFAMVGMDYKPYEKQIITAGEPGFAWLEMMRNYGRLKDGYNPVDHKVAGGNPCLEQSLESYELCNLVENFPVYHTDYWDYQRSLKFSYLYSKIVTLMGTHIERSNSVIIRNRRIGCSLSGIADAINKFGRTNFFQNFCDKGYSYINYLDKKYSDWLGVRQSIKKTSVKPSGTTSLVAGVQGPGVHFPKLKSGYRTIRVAANSDVVEILQKANYRIEPSVTDPIKTLVVYFPNLAPDSLRTEEEASIWEKFKLAADMQYYWADNQVSCTVEFNSKEAEAGEISRCLEAFDGQLKGISLLPKLEGLYAQMPYTVAPREEVEAYMLQLLPLDFSSLTIEGENASANLYCDSEKCVLKVA